MPHVIIIKIINVSITSISQPQYHSHRVFIITIVCLVGDKRSGMMAVLKLLRDPDQDNKHCASSVSRH